MKIPRNDMRQAMHRIQLKENTVKFAHIREYDDEGEVKVKGGTTVAYENLGDGFYRFAVAKCGPHDNYNKYVGRAKAGGKIKSPHHAQVVDKIESLDDLIAWVLAHRRELV